MTVDISEDEAPAPGKHGVFSRLYRGETRFDFVGRRRWWYLLSGIVIAAGLISLGTRGLNLGIDFKGGTSWTVAANGTTTAAATKAVRDAGVVPSVVQTLGIGSSAQLQVQADLSHESAAIRQAKENAVADSLARVTRTSPVTAERNVNEVGPTWGGDITNKAIIAVIVFLLVVILYISFRFEWKMAVAAIAAVLHDLLVVAGVYSLSGLQVTPDTVVAILTILGYSLYDTVVVFDRVADNTRNFGASGRMTYEDVVNLSMNQTLARSINTSLVAILPVLAVLVIGADFLGATTLQYFGFALVIGLLSGAYSSIFIASPLLAQMKEREPRYVSIRQKLEARSDRTGLLSPVAAAQLAAGGTSAARRAAGRAPARGRGAIMRPGAGARGQAGVAGSGTDNSGERAQVDGELAAAAPAGPRPGGSGGGAKPKGGSGARRPPQRKKGARKGGRRR